MGADDALKVAAKKNPASGKPRAIKTPIQKEALEAAFKSMLLLLHVDDMF